VPHHPARRQSVEHGQPTHHRLPDDAERQQHAEDRQIPAEGHAEEGQQAGGDGRQRHEAREHAIAELDPRMRVELGHEPAVLVALRPVRTPEPRPRDAHRRAGEDDQRQRDEGDRRDEEVALGDDAEAGAHGEKDAG
jgi:hypothetical protein